MKCPNCSEEIRDNSNFCRFCGFNLNSVRNHEDKMYCHNCGQQIEASSQFCSFCGSKVEPIIKEKTIDDYLLEAKNEFLDNNIEKSFELYEKAFKIDSRNEKALIGLIKTSFELDKYSNVISYLYNIDQPSTEILNYKLEAEIELKYWDSALRTINKLIENSDNDISLLYKKIQILEYSDKKPEIIPVYDKILSIENNNDVNYYNKSKLLFELSRFDESMDSIMPAIEINPSDKYLLLKNKIQKSIFGDEGNYDKAWDYFEECNYDFAINALDNLTDKKSLELKCWCLFLLNKNEESLLIINELLHLEENARYLNLQGKILFSMEDKDNSIDYFKKASKLNESYLSDLAFAYGAFDEIELSKEYYNQIGDKLSNVWIHYFNDDGDLLISGFINDFSNYPHLCCIKSEVYLKKSISFFEQTNLKKSLKFLNLSKKYLDKLEYFIEKNNLNSEYVSSNFIYLDKILIYFLQFKDFTFNEFDHKMANVLIDILKIILKYHKTSRMAKYFNDTDELVHFYKSIAKFYLSINSNELALKYFKIATDYVNNDGEIWLYIANLSPENNLIFYNKALFCFEKALKIKYDEKFKRLKSLCLYYLNRETEAINFIENMLPRYEQTKIKSYFNRLNKHYAGR